MTLAQLDAARTELLDLQAATRKQQRSKTATRCLSQCWLVVWSCVGGLGCPALACCAAPPQEVWSPAGKLEASAPCGSTPAVQCPSS